MSEWIEHSTFNKREGVLRISDMLMHERIPFVIKGLFYFDGKEEKEVKITAVVKEVKQSKKK